ncbi:hypothetical protein ACJRO0_04865 [Acetobacter oryzifermentans]|uniref:hypothetical protein n=1 Tax=Acetobacter oryzifermentans TaxID=1633874 RepID=UPI0039BF6918
MSEEANLEFLCIHQGLSIVGLLKPDDEQGAERAKSLGFSVTKMVPEQEARAGEKA